MENLFKRLLNDLRYNVIDDLTIVLKQSTIKKVIKLSNSIYDDADDLDSGFDMIINGRLKNEDESYSEEKILQFLGNFISTDFELEKIITNNGIIFEMPSPEVLQLFTLKQLPLGKEEAIQVVILLYKYFKIFIKKAFGIVMNNVQNQDITLQLVNFDNNYKDLIINYINDNINVIIFDEDLDENIETEYSGNLIFRSSGISDEISLLRRRINNQKTMNTDYFANNYELKNEYFEKLYSEIKGQVELSLSQQIGRLVNQSPQNEEYSEKLARNLLMEKIVPLIKNQIEEWLEIRINALSKNIKTSITTLKKTIRKQGFKVKHHRQTKLALTSKLKKLKKELRTKNYTLDTITQVFYPMIRDQHTLTAWIHSEYPLEIKVNSIIQIYLQERAVPQIEEQQVQQPLEDFNLNITTENVNIPEEDCPICFTTMDNTERLCQLPCGHSFHCNCLKGMRKQKLKCPVCNAENNGVIKSNTFGKSKILKILCKELKYLLSLK